MLNPNITLLDLSYVTCFNGYYGVIGYVDSNYYIVFKLEYQK